MIGVIYDRLVQQYQVLVYIATPYQVSGCTLVALLYPGQQLQYLKYIGFSKDHRQFFDLGWRDIYHPHLCGLHVLLQ